MDQQQFCLLNGVMQVFNNQLCLHSNTETRFYLHTYFYGNITIRPFTCRKR